MAVCEKCGKEVPEGSSFCPSCGAVMNQGTPTPSNDAQENKTMAILAYILFFIPILTGDYKKSPFVFYHTNQGTVLFISAVVCTIGLNIIRQVMYSIFWGFGLYGLIGTLLGLINLAFIVLLVMGIINANSGQTKPLPIIGGFQILK